MSGLVEDDEDDGDGDGLGEAEIGLSRLPRKIVDLVVFGTYACARCCPVPLDLSHGQAFADLGWLSLSGKTSCVAGRPSASGSEPSCRGPSRPHLLTARRAGASIEKPRSRRSAQVSHHAANASADWDSGITPDRRQATAGLLGSRSWVPTSRDAVARPSPGSEFSAVAAVRHDYGISVLAALRDEGLIITTPGWGSFVAGKDTKQT